MSMSLSGQRAQWTSSREPVLDTILDTIKASGYARVCLSVPKERVVSISQTRR